MLDFERIINTGEEPKALLMTLTIETSYRSAPSLYAEVFRIPDGTGVLYWLYELNSNHLVQLIKDYSNKNNIPLNKRVEEVCKQPCFIEEYQKINPVQSAAITKDKMPVIYKIINEGLPKDVKYPHGLDGHEYYLSTYGKKQEEYRAWSVIPNEWGIFDKLITTLVEIGNWNSCYRCSFGYRDTCHNIDKATAEIPPWIKT